MGLTLEEKMKQKFEQAKKEKEKETKEIVIVENQEKNEKIIDEKFFNLSLCDLTEDQSINNYLKEKTIEYTNFTAKGSLWYGKFYEDIFLELSSRDGGANQYNSTYSMYLENVLGVKTKTALRHRKRYQLYNETNDIGKKIVATLPFRELEFLYTNKDQYLEKLEKKEISIEEFSNLLQSFKIENAKQKELQLEEEINFEIITEKILGIEKKLSVFFEELKPENQSKAQKINKLLENLEEILKD